MTEDRRDVFTAYMRGTRFEDWGKTGMSGGWGFSSRDALVGGEHRLF